MPQLYSEYEHFGGAPPTDFEGDVINPDHTDTIEDANDSVAQIVKNYTQGIANMKDSYQKEIGDLAVWSASSEKVGYTLKSLRKDNIDSYWQSDGPQPHYIDIHFSKRVQISEIALFTSLKLDESYSPNRIKIYIGNGYHDLMLAKDLELNNVNDWVNIPLLPDVIKCFLIRVCIEENHQNGKDTHLRGLKLFTPVDNDSHSAIGDFTSLQFKAQSSIR